MRKLIDHAKNLTEAFDPCAVSTLAHVFQERDRELAKINEEWQRKLGEVSREWDSKIEETCSRVGVQYDAALIDAVHNYLESDDSDDLKAYSILVTDGSETYRVKVSAINQQEASKIALARVEKKFGTSSWRVDSVERKNV